MGLCGRSAWRADARAPWSIRGAGLISLRPSRCSEGHSAARLKLLSHGFDGALVCLPGLLSCTGQQHQIGQLGPATGDVLGKLAQRGNGPSIQHRPLAYSRLPLARNELGRIFFPYAARPSRKSSYSDSHCPADSKCCCWATGKNAQTVRFSALLCKILAIRKDPIIMKVVLAQAGKGLPPACCVGP